jgi:hypothetical protein
MKKRKESISMWLWDSIAALTEGPPKGSVFACSHLYWVESFSLPKVLYFRRTPELDELWEATVVEKEVLGDFSKLKDPETHACHPYERRVAAPCRGAEAEACRNLLAAMFSAKSGFSGPTEHFICGGLVDESCYATIVTEYRDRREQNHRLAMEVFRKSEIIVAARALGLDPKPGCEESAMWTAGCPGRSHHLAIHAVHNEFYCGYCVRKGGIPELEYFCTERRKPYGDQGGNETSAVTGK